MAVSVFGCDCREYRAIPPTSRVAVARNKQRDRLAVQRHSEVVDGSDRVLVPTAKRNAVYLQRLAVARLSLVVIALGL